MDFPKIVVLILFYVMAFANEEVIQQIEQEIA